MARNFFFIEAQGALNSKQLRSSGKISSKNKKHRAREIAKKLRPLGLTWSCNSRANLDYDTIKSFKDSGLRLFLVGYESGNDDILTRIKKGVTMDEMRRFTKSCHQAGVVIHGTFILGLPVETRETIENTITFAKELDVFSIQ